MSVLNDVQIRRGGTLAAAVVGAYVLDLAAHPESDGRTAFLSFLAGIDLFVPCSR